MSKIEDRQGHTLSGATESAAKCFDDAVECFNLFRGDPVKLLDAALAEAPEFAMARILKGWLFALTAEAPLMTLAANLVGSLDAAVLCDREALHLEALRLLCRGEWGQSGQVLNRVSSQWPRDIVALQAGHQIDFFRASDQSLANRIDRVLPDWSPDIPGYGAVLGMQAFALEENADYLRAEEIGRRAVALDPRDGWAHHAVAHVMEMQGRPDEGLVWMAEREPFWADEASFFRIHNWWHRGLFHIETNDPAGALNLYDVALAGSGPLALNLADAASLLWRLHCSAVDVGERFKALARAWDARHPTTGSAFLDLHMAMAYLGAGEIGKVDGMLNAKAALDGESALWRSKYGKPLIAGFRQFAVANFEVAADQLFNFRSLSDAFGGSHAQRDVIDWTLTEAAVRGGRAGLAEGLARERQRLRPHSPINRSFVARAEALQVR